MTGNTVGDCDLRVLYLKQRFNPEPAPIRGAAFTDALRNHGVDVTVLTGFPYYPYAHLHDGYRQRWHDTEQIGDTTVERSPSVIGHSGSPIRRALAYATLPVAATATARGRRMSADLVMTTLGPGTYAPCAVLLARSLGVPCVLEVQDLWPESLQASGMWPAAIPLAPIVGMLSWAYRRADAITCLSAGCRDAVVARGGRPSTVVTSLNWAPEVTTTDADRRTARGLLDTWSDQPFLVYAGTIGPLQGVDRMVEAAHHANVGLVVVGSGHRADEAETQARRLRAPVRFLGQRDLGVAQALVELSQAAIVYLASSPLDASAIPSKLAASFAAGVPTIVAATGETAKLAEQVGAGPRCGPDDTQALADAFGQVVEAGSQQITEWRANAKAFATQWLQPEVGIGRLAELLRTVAARRPLAELQDREHRLVGKLA